MAALVVFAADRLSKWWAQTYLAGHSPIELFRFFWLTYIENTGAAFGVLYGSNRLLTVVAVAMLAALIRFHKTWAKDGLSRLALAMVAGGALGNLYDRLAYGHVVDFFDFRVWPVFNVADSCITVGAVLLVWSLRET